MTKKLNIKLPGWLKTTLKLLLTGGMLYLVFSKIDGEQVWNYLKSANLLLLAAATILFILSKLISSYRLNLFFICTGLKLKQIFNIKLYLLGMYYNLFLPGGIGGDGYKIYLLNKKFGTKVKDLFWATVLDRLTGLLALFLLAVLILYFVPAPEQFLSMKGMWFFEQRVYLIWLLMPLSLFFFLIVIKRFFNKFYSIFHKTNLQALGVQLAQTICAWFILLSLGIHDHSMQYLLVFLISSIVATIPFTIGGVGAREFTFLIGASLLELNIEASIALSLIFYLITALVSFCGIYYSFNKQALEKGLLQEDS